MKKYLVASLASVLILQAGCAQRPPRQNEAPAPEQTVISENEQRIHELEDKVSALDAQIAQMNSRVYDCLLYTSASPRAGGTDGVAGG
ncbi:MAG: hypothetical protein K1W05_05185, partial [Desulfovibrio sp.]